jgi:hypothetical protein
VRTKCRPGASRTISTAFQASVFCLHYNYMLTSSCRKLDEKIYLCLVSPQVLILPKGTFLLTFSYRLPSCAMTIKQEDFFVYFIQYCFICRPSDSIVSEDAGIEPWTVATSALAVRCSNQSTRSHPQSARYHPQWQFKGHFEKL